MSFNSLTLYIESEEAIFKSQLTWPLPDDVTALVFHEITTKKTTLNEPYFNQNKGVFLMVVSNFKSQL